MYQATCLIVVDGALSFTKIFGAEYATLAAAQSAALSGTNSLQLQITGTGLIPIVPVFLTIDLTDGASMPIHLRTSAVLALLPGAGQV